MGACTGSGFEILHVQEERRRQGQPLLRGIRQPTEIDNETVGAETTLVEIHFHLLDKAHLLAPPREVEIYLKATRAAHAALATWALSAETVLPIRLRNVLVQLATFERIIDRSNLGSVFRSHVKLWPHATAIAAMPTLAHLLDDWSSVINAIVHPEGEASARAATLTF